MISINFLPSEQKNKIKWQLINRFVLFYGSLFVFLAVLLLAILFAFDYFLVLYHDDLEKQIGNFKQSKLATEVGDIENTIKSKNKEMEAVLILQKGTPRWSGLLEEVAQNVPPGVAIISLNSQENNKVLLTGHAATREELLEFNDNLEKSKYFSDVVLPFPDLTKRTDVDFGITLVLNKGALQNGQ